MYRKIVTIIAVLSFLFAWGIIGGIDNGQPIINALYLIPSLGVTGFCAWLLE